MNVGLWSPPAVLAGLFAFLWAATWLDRLISPSEADRRMPPTVVPGPAQTAGHLETLGMDR
jgi:hypothetical protein